MGARPLVKRLRKVGFSHHFEVSLRPKVLNELLLEEACPDEERVDRVRGVGLDHLLGVWLEIFK